jgi:hypothetical protein
VRLGMGNTPMAPSDKARDSNLMLFPSRRSLVKIERISNLSVTWLIFKLLLDIPSDEAQRPSHMDLWPIYYENTPYPMDS